MTSKGKLRSGSKIIDIENEQPLINNNINAQTTIEYEEISWGTIIMGWVKTVILFILLGIFLLVGTYAGLSATILYATQAGNSDPFIVARGTYVGGKVPENSFIYVNTKGEIENNFLSNLSEGFGGIKDGAVVKTLAGPVQELLVDNKKETITIIEDGETKETIDGVLPEEYAGTDFLKNQYLVECMAGACEKGELLIIDQNQISGEVITVGG